MVNYADNLFLRKLRHGGISRSVAEALLERIGAGGGGGSGGAPLSDGSTPGYTDPTESGRAVVIGSATAGMTDVAALTGSGTGVYWNPDGSADGFQKFIIYVGGEVGHTLEFRPDGRFLIDGESPYLGAPVVRAFHFSHDSPGLTDGFPVYTPPSYEVLLDAWFSVDVAWNGTTPMADIAPQGAISGWFASSVGSAVPLDHADQQQVPGLVSQHIAADEASSDLLATSTRLGAATPARLVPGRFAGDPIWVVVSQDGLKGSAAAGSTQGEATLYMVTADPV